MEEEILPLKIEGDRGVREQIVHFKRITTPGLFYLKKQQTKTKQNLKICLGKYR